MPRAARPGPTLRRRSARPGRPCRRAGAGHRSPSSGPRPTACSPRVRLTPQRAQVCAEVPAIWPLEPVLPLASHQVRPPCGLPGGIGLFASANRRSRLVVFGAACSVPGAAVSAAGAPPPLLSHTAPPPAAGSRMPWSGVPPPRAARCASRRRRAPRLRSPGRSGPQRPVRRHGMPTRTSGCSGRSSGVASRTTRTRPRSAPNVDPGRRAWAGSGGGAGRSTSASQPAPGGSARWSPPGCRSRRSGGRLRVRRHIRRCRRRRRGCRCHARPAVRGRCRAARPRPAGSSSGSPSRWSTVNVGSTTWPMDAANSANAPGRSSSTPSRQLSLHAIPMFHGPPASWAAMSRGLSVASRDHWPRGCFPRWPSHSRCEPPHSGRPGWSTANTVKPCRSWSQRATCEDVRSAHAARLPSLPEGAETCPPAHISMRRCRYRILAACRTSARGAPSCSAISTSVRPSSPASAERMRRISAPVGARGCRSRGGV